MSRLFKNRYRIVPDNYAGYEVQIRRWWFPVWIEKGFTNTFSSIKAARNYAKTGGSYEEGEL